MDKIKLGSLFSGIGGFELAGSWYNFEPVWASEIEAAPIRITKRHFPNMKHVGDITKLDGHALEPVDIITGGSPCTDISVAGTQAGIKLVCPNCGKSVSANSSIRTCPDCETDLELTRSGLFIEQIRVIKEMLEATNYEYPKIIVWENVSAAISSNNGDDFQCVLQEFCGLISERIPTLRPERWTKSGEILGKSGSIAWRTFDAQYWGVPQRRRRIFLIADLRGQCAGKILFEQESLRRNYSKSKKPWETTTRKAESCIGISDSDNAKHGSEELDSVYCLQGNGIDRADTAGCNGCGWRKNQCYTLNTIDRPAVVYDAKPYVATFKYQQAAAMATLPYDENMSSTLTSRQNIAVLINNHPADSRVELSNVCQTLTSRMGTGGGNTPYVLEQQEVFSQSGFADFKDSDGTFGTLTRQGESSGGDSESLISDPLDCKSIVRRLTPLECERLQGFPDNWTARESDNARYKALGNSVALPCVDYIMSGIADVLDDK